MARPDSASEQRLAALAVLVTAGFIAVLLFRQRQVELALHLYAVVMGGLGAAWLTGRALPFASADRRLGLGWRRRRRRDERVRGLEELEHAVDFSLTTAFDVHYRLRPHLIRIARHRLAARHGILLDEDHAAARAALGSDAWELVRPDRPPPEDRNARGVELGRLRAVVDALDKA
jgi:hypothetical protein